VCIKQAGVFHDCIGNDLSKERDAVLAQPSSKWSTVLPRTRVTADHRHFFDAAGCDVDDGSGNVGGCGVAATHWRIKIYPDGGVSRVRLSGVKL
jgi:allantoicase